MVPTDLLPVFEKVLADTEETLTSLCGYPVKVNFKLCPKNIDENAIASAVCARFGITYSNLISQCRERNYVMARVAFAHLCHIHLGYTLARTGKILGKHHTTLLNYKYIMNSKGDVIEDLHDKLFLIQQDLHNG